MLSVVSLVFFLNNDRLDGPEFFMLDTKDVLNVSIPKVLFRNIHLTLVFVHLVCYIDYWINLLYPPHHIYQVSEECFCSVKLEFVFISSLTFVTNLRSFPCSFFLIILDSWRYNFWLFFSSIFSRRRSWFFLEISDMEDNKDVLLHEVLDHSDKSSDDFGVFIQLVNAAQVAKKFD